MKYSVRILLGAFGIWQMVGGPFAYARESATASTPLPEELARESFLKGDIAYLRVPACVDTVPLDRGTKRVLAPQRVLATCGGLESKWISEIRDREVFARRYNNAMFDLRVQAGKK